MEECDFILMDKFIKFKKKLSDRDFVEFYNATVDFYKKIEKLTTATNILYKTGVIN